MPFEFVSDRPGLDFVATVAERGTTDLELLRTPADLVEWIRESGLVDDVATLRAEDLDRARAVREALFALLQALRDGSPPPPAARRTANAAAAQPGPRPVLDASGSVRHRGGLDAALSALATDVLDLHGDADRLLLSWCADDRCTRPFVDRSRGQRRRWCGMRGCGDRAKAAAYRERQRVRR
ncbi:MAG TPA: ABATE domain-containing protein [Mycobacteriales bacterium]|nr:ABATE domain-containing protein [Mycobacteriales bacterium]